MEQKFNFEKYKDIPLKLTKLQDNRFFGEHPNQIYEGAVRRGILHLDLSNQYQCVFILEGSDRYFHTSQVKKIQEQEGYDLITTLNSVYKVEFEITAIPGEQKKYSVKLEDSE